MGNAVHQDKIGASNFFWSFPSEAAVKVWHAHGCPACRHACMQSSDNSRVLLGLQLKNNVKQSEASLAELEASCLSLDQKIEHSRKGKEFSVSRSLPKAPTLKALLPPILQVADWQICSCRRIALQRWRRCSS